MKVNKVNNNWARNALHQDKGPLDTKLTKLKEHMQDENLRFNSRWFESEHRKMKNYARILHKKKQISKQEVLTEEQEKIKDFLAKNNIENLFITLKVNGFDDMDTLLDIRDHHLNSMEIRPEDQL